MEAHLKSLSPSQKANFDLYQAEIDDMYQARANPQNQIYQAAKGFILQADLARREIKKDTPKSQRLKINDEARQLYTKAGYYLHQLAKSEKKSFSEGHLRQLEQNLLTRISLVKRPARRKWF